jgi:hypothetical protein
MKWGRRWLDDVVSGRLTTVAQLGVREKYIVRQVNMTISLAFLAPSLVRTAVEDRLLRGVGIEPKTINRCRSTVISASIRNFDLNDEASTARKKQSSPIIPPA